MVLIDFPKFRTHKFMIASLQLIFLQGYERLASRVSLTGQKKDSGSGETTISIPWAWELRPQMSKCAQTAHVLSNGVVPVAVCAFWCDFRSKACSDCFE